MFFWYRFVRFDLDKRPLIGWFVVGPHRPHYAMHSAGDASRMSQVAWSVCLCVGNARATVQKRLK